MRAGAASRIEPAPGAPAADPGDSRMHGTGRRAASTRSRRICWPSVAGLCPRLMEDYLRAVREGCTPAQWSRAVEAARSGKVHALRVREGQKDREGPTGEFDFRVETRPGQPAHKVTLSRTPRT